MAPATLGSGLSPYARREPPSYLFGGAHMALLRLLPTLGLAVFVTCFVLTSDVPVSILD